MYGSCFWIFAAANTFFHLNVVIIADSWTGFCLDLLWKHESNLRRSHWNSFVKKGVLRNFANFTGKHLFCSLFSIELQVCSFIEKRLQHRCFPMESTKFLRTPNLEYGNNCFWKLFLHLDCPNNQTPLAQINAYSLFSFCITTYIFICQYSLATIDTAMCVCVYVHPPWRLHLSGLVVQGTEQRCCVEDVFFLYQVPSSILQYESPSLSN